MGGVWRCGVLRLRAAGPCAGDVATAGYAFFLLEDIKISPCGVWWSQQSAASASASAMASASKKRSKRRHSVQREARSADLSVVSVCYYACAPVTEFHAISYRVWFC